MTGQDAVRSAEEFHARIGITGVVLTKMDGDARGGAALSIKQVTGQPVKFVGVGEKYDALEPFYPDRVAQRILGMGDVLSLIEQVQDKIDQSDAEAQLQKLQRNQFTLDDFRSQLGQVKKLGSFSKILKLLPDQLLGGVGMPDLTDEQSELMEKELKRTEAIIDSMTREERLNHIILNANRRRRIARGSGTTVAQVNSLIKQYTEMRRMMQGMFSGGGLRGKMMRTNGRYSRHGCRRRRSDDGRFAGRLPVSEEEEEEEAKAIDLRKPIVKRRALAAHKRNV